MLRTSRRLSRCRRALCEFRGQISTFEHEVGKMLGLRFHHWSDAQLNIHLIINL